METSGECGGYYSNSIHVRVRVTVYLGSKRRKNGGGGTPDLIITDHRFRLVS